MTGQQPTAEELRRRIAARIEWDTDQLLVESSMPYRSPRGTPAEAWFTDAQLREIDEAEKSARIDEMLLLDDWRRDVASTLRQRSVSPSDIRRDPTQRIDRSLTR